MTDAGRPPLPGDEGDRQPVVTFEEPLLVRVDDEAQISALRQWRRRQIGLFTVRIAVAVALCGVAPFVDVDSVPWSLAIAGVYLPVMGLLGIGTLGQRVWLRRLAMLGDVALITAFLVDAGPVEPLALTPLLLVAAHAWAGDRVAAVGAAVLFTCSAVLVDVTEVAELPLLSIVASAAVALVVAAMISDQHMLESRATSGLRLVHDKAEAILAGIADAVVTTTPEGEVRDINRSARDVLGVGERSVTGTACAALLGLRDGVRTLRCVGRCELLEEAGTPVEVSRTGPNGQRQPMLASAVPLVGVAGEPVEIIHSLRDISSVKQADEAKTLFLATASHELKTPLTVIRGFAQMLRGGKLDAHQQSSAATAIEERADQLAGIVDRLLMTSRIESGRVELAPHLASVAALLSRRVEEARTGSGRRFDLVLDPDLPPAWLDEDALTTVVDHLFDNAIKYSPDGEPVTVSISVVDDRVEVAVTDRGVGMTESQREHCFERFWQAEGTDVRRFGGTGIGLYIVRSLVEAMGARVSVDSAPGEGTTFRVALRRHPPQADDNVEANLQAPAASQASVIDELVRQAQGSLEETRGA